jgi:hypothetical protein
MASEARFSCDYVICNINVRRPNGTLINVSQESHETHVDTNAFFFFPSAFHMLPVWLFIPPQTAVVGDRVFYLAMRAAKLTSVEATKFTVNYTCTWESTYQAIGEPPPANAKPTPDHYRVASWIGGLDETNMRIMNTRLGADLRDLYPWLRGAC